MEGYALTAWISSVPFPFSGANASAVSRGASTVQRQVYSETVFFSTGREPKYYGNPFSLDCQGPGF